MARIRTLKPDFFRSRSLTRVPMAARLTFQGLWCEADDHGRGIADARLLKGSIWPLDDDVRPPDVSAHLDDLERTGHIRLYEVEGESYYEVISWDKHQAAAYRRGDAVHPPPPAETSSGDMPHDQSCKKVRDARPIVLEGKGREGNREGNRESTSDSNGSESLALVPYPSTPAASCSFDDFWPSYPKRNGKRVGKPKTLERWKRLSPDDRQAALIGARFYAMACDNGLTIAKDPERWVRDRCWDDWQEPAEVSTPRARPKSMDLLERRMAMHRAAEA